MKRSRKARETTKRIYAEMAADASAARDPALVERAKALGYSEAELRSVPDGAAASLGCGNPTAFAELREGETVLDLGSGGGLDAFLAAQRVGRSGKVIGVDMTPEMVEKARANARKGDFGNVEFRLGEIERLPVEDASVDVIVSNCTMNHCPDKLAAFREAFRVLRPGGRMLLSDLVTAGAFPEDLRRGLDKAWADWLSVAAPKQEYLKAITDAGFRDVQVLAEQAFEYPGMHERLSGRVVSIQVKGAKPASPLDLR